MFIDRASKILLKENDNDGGKSWINDFKGNV